MDEVGTLCCVIPPVLYFTVCSWAANKIVAVYTPLCERPAVAWLTCAASIGRVVPYCVTLLSEFSAVFRPFG